VFIEIVIVVSEIDNNFYKQPFVVTAVTNNKKTPQSMRCF